MAQNYAVEYSSDGVTYSTLANVQTFTVNIGRHRQLDPYSSSRASITIRYPTGYASPITAITSGNYCRIKNTTTNTFVFNGIINNVNVQYGIPYASGVGNADFLTFTIEGSFARFGRARGNNYSMAADTLQNQLTNCAVQTGLNIGTSTPPASPAMGADVIDNTWGDWINQVLLTTNGRMIDADTLNVLVLSPFTSYVSTVNFSDAANNATNQVFDQIHFGSYADNYYTQVTVDPEGFAAATVQTGSAPFRTLLMNTLNASTAQATDFANYLLANYDNQGAALLSISCLAEAQNTFKLDQLAAGRFTPQPDSLAAVIGTQVNVTFRGTTFTCIIEGVTMSATPASSRYTYYLSGADLNAYLILDNAVFGKLDSNKLGY